jgi:hypothetical protein
MKLEKDNINEGVRKTVWMRLKEAQCRNLMATSTSRCDILKWMLHEVGEATLCQAEHAFMTPGERLPEFPENNRHMKVASLSALHTGHLYP